MLKLGTLGAGNHYAEIQVVDEIYNEYAAKKMGIDHKGQVCVMIHSGSRGLGHQVATGRPGRKNPAVPPVQLATNGTVVNRCSGCHGESHEA